MNWLSGLKLVTEDGWFVGWIDPVAEVFLERLKSDE